MEKKVIIVGGGFAGISAALELEKRHIPGLKIILISDKPHFEFTASIYRVLTGHSPLEVCIPLSQIFEDKNVEVLQDKITFINVINKKLSGTSEITYKYDYLILAAGCQVNYFGIEGLKEYSYNLHDITQGLRLKRHIHEIFTAAETLPQDEQKEYAHIVIVGGGASGCEIAGELASYTKKLARQHHLNESLIRIDLIHSGSRLLEFLPENVTARITDQLKKSGVNIMLNEKVMKEELETVYLPDAKMKTKTLIWTAGAKPNDVFEGVKEFNYDNKGRVKVDSHLKAYENVYVVGDGAATKYSGMARPAISSGAFVAREIISKLQGQSDGEYREEPSPFIIPVGPDWAATNGFGPMIYGRLGILIGRARDMRYFLSILPLRKAWVAYEADGHLTESCPVCSKA